MSVRVMADVWKLRLSPGEKLVMLALADCANDEGECWPSMRTIAGKSSRTERSAFMVIAKLERAGLIERISEAGRLNHYRINSCKKFTPAKNSPLKKQAPTPENFGMTPENFDSAYIDEPSIEPSRTINDSAPDAAPLTIEEVLEDWNTLAGDCGLPKAKLTPQRRRAGNVRLREYPDIADWRRAFGHIRRTPWLLGENDRGWRANFDFLLQAKSFTKLVEESYGQAQ